MLKRGLSLFRLLITVLAYAKISPFKTRNACLNYLREQHSGISWKCGKCHKNFRRNNYPHQCRAKEADYHLFSTISGASREDVAVELEMFEAKAYRNLVTVVTHSTTFTTPKAPLPHASARKRTQPVPLFSGKKQRHLSSSTLSLLSSSSSLLPEKALQSGIWPT